MKLAPFIPTVWPGRLWSTNSGLGTTTTPGNRSLDAPPSFAHQTTLESLYSVQMGSVLKVKLLRHVLCRLRRSEKESACGQRTVYLCTPDSYKWEQTTRVLCMHLRNCSSASVLRTASRSGGSAWHIAHAHLCMSMSGYISASQSRVFSFRAPMLRELGNLTCHFRALEVG